jgi:assimilatory nitrate reductase catalytic subunit
MAGEGRANLLPGPLVDPVSGQPAFKNSAVRIEPVIPEWRAFLVSVGSRAPSGLLWWSRSRVKGGWLHEMAGIGAVDCDALLPSGHRLEVTDAVRGTRRIVVTGANGAVAAALFVTRSGQLPPRDWISGQLDGGDGAVAIELLAGRPATPAPDRGPVVCICHGVGTNAILAAIGAGAGSVGAVGNVTFAGTNCGSCRPAISRLIAEAMIMKEAAE